jgi:hypothetical protein
MARPKTTQGNDTINIITTMIGSPDAEAAAQRGKDEAERQLQMLTSFLPPPNAIKQLRDEAAEMVKYCWETDRGWVKFAYYRSMLATFEAALREINPSTRPAKPLSSRGGTAAR